METIFKIFAYLLLAIILWRLIRMLSTPLFKLLGLYIYYSPTFFLHKLTPRLYEVHIGTTWDYLQMEKISPKIFMMNMSMGMIGMIEDIKSEKIHPDSKIVGSIHYFNPKTTERFGFKNRKMNLFEWLLFVLSYIETTVLLSITYGRPMLPRLLNTRIHFSKAKELLLYEDMYNSYYQKFSDKRQRIETLV
jgi:hypothetical protein